MSWAGLKIAALSVHCLPLQGIGLMDKETMMDKAKEPWNPMSSVPLERWLSEVRCPMDGDRLKCLGNIVIPAQARLAMRQLVHDL